MAIIQLEAGLAPSNSPRCAVVFPQQHRFFDSLKERPHGLSFFNIFPTAAGATGVEPMRYEQWQQKILRRHGDGLLRFPLHFRNRADAMDVSAKFEVELPLRRVASP